MHFFVHFSSNGAAIYFGALTIFCCRLLPLSWVEREPRKTRELQWAIILYVIAKKRERFYSPLQNVQPTPRTERTRKNAPPTHCGRIGHKEKRAGTEWFYSLLFLRALWKTTRLPLPVLKSVLECVPHFFERIFLRFIFSAKPHSRATTMMMTMPFRDALAVFWRGGRKGCRDGRLQMISG